MKVIKDGYLRLPLTKENVEIAKRHYSYVKAGEILLVSSADFRPESNEIVFPRNTKRLKAVTGKVLKIDDRRIIANSPTKLELSDSFKLREYQVEPVKEVLDTLKTCEDNACILQALPSFGKSYVLPKIVSELRQNTLIIIDRTLLVEQMYSEFTHNTKNSEEIIILDKHNYKEDGSVYITTFQFLLKNPDVVEYLARRIGLVVVDEAHTIGSEVFTKVMTEFPAKYRLGLSATPTRSDGLTQILSDTFSDNIIVGTNPTNLTIQVIGIKCSQKAEWVGKSYADVATYNLTQPYIERAVVSTVLVSKKHKRTVMIYTNYKEIREFYKTALLMKGISSAIIDGKTKKEERVRILKDLQDGKIDVLLTGVIIQKGVSIHVLDTIVNLGHHNKESLEQLWGRLRREHNEKKKPMFIDFFISGVLRNQANERYQLSKKLARKSGDEFKPISYEKYMEILKAK